MKKLIYEVVSDIRNIDGEIVETVAIAAFADEEDARQFVRQYRAAHSIDSCRLA